MGAPLSPVLTPAGHPRLTTSRTPWTKAKHRTPPRGDVTTHAKRRAGASEPAFALTDARARQPGTGSRSADSHAPVTATDRVALLVMCTKPPRTP